MYSDNHRLINKLYGRNMDSALAKSHPRMLFFLSELLTVHFQDFFFFNFSSTVKCKSTSYHPHLPPRAHSCDDSGLLFSLILIFHWKFRHGWVYFFSLVEVINEITEDQVLWMTYIALEAHKF